MMYRWIPFNKQTCPKQCICESLDKVGDGACWIPKGSCDTRASHAYAVNRRAFDGFEKLYQQTNEALYYDAAKACGNMPLETCNASAIAMFGLRELRVNALPWVDMWLQRAFDNVYFAPSLMNGNGPHQGWLINAERAFIEKCILRAGYTANSSYPGGNSSLT